MWRRQNGWVGLMCGLALWVVACSGPQPTYNPTLRAPAGSNQAAVEAVEKGNRLFGEGRWGGAMTQYEIAIRHQADLAEAHYNLGLTLDRLGDPEQARVHYIEAANLAPGHKVIWNSRALRRYGDVPDKVGQNSSSAPVLPSLGGLGGGGGPVGR